MIVPPPLQKIWKLVLLTLTDPRGGGFFLKTGTNPYS